MNADHVAVGITATVRVDVRWTPRVEGVEMIVRNPETLEEYGCWKVPRLTIWPYTPDERTFHSAVRRVLGAIPEPSGEVLAVLAAARENALTWHPEKLV
ncbi:hypothetical protein [Streptomyces sp. 4F14]|uniref:hypothetical protein n=1 Tax=Streptomyces sp. 4F14 TaxID=3394380 RepID=UPI003A85B31A